MYELREKDCKTVKENMPCVDIMELLRKIKNIKNDCAAFLCLAKKPKTQKSRAHRRPKRGSLWTASESGQAAFMYDGKRYDGER